MNLNQKLKNKLCANTFRKIKQVEGRRYFIFGAPTEIIEIIDSGEITKYRKLTEKNIRKDQTGEKRFFYFNIKMR